MSAVTIVEVGTADPDRYAEVLTDEQTRAFRGAVDNAVRCLEGRTVWNVNSTAHGGGVAEMLSVLLSYARGAGIDGRWAVIEGDDDFFHVTKRIHNNLHGAPGDGGDLGDAEQRLYTRTLAPAADELRALVGDGDVVVLHDPQTAGLIPMLRERGVPVVWRCHVGLDMPNELARRAWRFLIPHVEQADAHVFSRRAFAWEGLDAERMRVIAPSIDPFSAKNCIMTAPEVSAVLAISGLLPDKTADHELATYPRPDGTRALIEHRCEMDEVMPLDGSTPMVVQVSRWDRLKDPVGVVEGFAAHVLPRCDAQLVLAGPAVAEVADDPEGLEVFREVQRYAHALPDEVRAHVHLACLPMDDDDENAVMVNALQRRARVVVQKSLAEGFGLTVAEAMWKSKPVVASRIGGIQDQIEDAVSGILLDNPRDLAGFGEQVCALLSDPGRAGAIGEAAHERVREHFLGARHLVQYGDLLCSLVDGRRLASRGVTAG